MREQKVNQDWQKYRLLNEGEIVRETDEILLDNGKWGKPQNSIGQAAPSPLYTSHRKFRRRSDEK